MSTFPSFAALAAAVAMLALTGPVSAEPSGKQVRLAAQAVGGNANAEEDQAKKKKKPPNAFQPVAPGKPAAKKQPPAKSQQAKPKVIAKPPVAKAPPAKTAPPAAAMKAVPPAAVVKSASPPPTLGIAPPPRPGQVQPAKKPAPAIGIAPPPLKQTKPVTPVVPPVTQIPATVAKPNLLRPVVKPAPRVEPAVVKQNFKAPPKASVRLDDVKKNRKETVVAGGKVRVIKEEDKRVIVKQGNRTFIRHDESERFRRIAPDARTLRRPDGSYQTVVARRDGVRVYDVADRNGRLLYRSRRYPDGRDVVLIDNRHYYREERYRGRDLALGVGIGLAVGAAIVALAPPVIEIPRERYIVEYDRASDEDIYEALTAPPVERLERIYSLEEVRYSPALRDRMRRVDLENVTFDFGSWEVGADQEQALAKIAGGINRALEANGDEIFMIEGHTDAVGSEDDNLSLSDRRAQAVAEILTTNFGVPPENLVTQGYGEEYLKVQTQEPERANRRIAVRRISPLMSKQFREGAGEQPDPPEQQH